MKLILIARWTAINGSVLFIAIMAVFYNFEPAEHIITFLVCFYALTSLALLHEGAADKTFDTDSASFTVLPRWVDITYDAILVGILLWPGWYILAALYAFFCILQQSAYEAWRLRQIKGKTHEKTSRSR